jgi:hypothetical protein
MPAVGIGLIHRDDLDQRSTGVALESPPAYLPAVQSHDVAGGPNLPYRDAPGQERVPGSTAPRRTSGSPFRTPGAGGRGSRSGPAAGRGRSPRPEGRAPPFAAPYPLPTRGSRPTRPTARSRSGVSRGRFSRPRREPRSQIRPNPCRMPRPGAEVCGCVTGVSMRPARRRGGPDRGSAGHGK